MSSFTVGQTYKMDEIRAVTGGEIQSYLPQRDGRIVCGRFTLKMNPDAPEEVPVGVKKKVVEKAETLSRQADSRIPVFTKPDGRGSEWTYRGVYEFKDLIDDADAIARAGAIF